MWYESEFVCCKKYRRILGRGNRRLQTLVEIVRVENTNVFLPAPSV